MPGSITSVITSTFTAIKTSDTRLYLIPDEKIYFSYLILIQLLYFKAKVSVACSTGRRVITHAYHKIICALL